VSMSRETTFERDLHAVRDRTELTRVFTQLAEQVAADLQRKAYAGRTIGIKLRFDDFRTVTRDLTLPAPTADAAAIRHAAGLCLKRVDLTRRLRLLGVRAAGLVRAEDVAEGLYRKPNVSTARRAGEPASRHGRSDDAPELPMFETG
jgi:DNA polymerase-4